MDEDLQIKANLCDSNDDLSDPSNPQNLFDIDLGCPLLTERNLKCGNSEPLVDIGGIETPAFGKKKTPSLAFFKGEISILDNKKKGKQKK
jgi:hypothetical protein